MAARTWFCTECGEPNKVQWSKCHNCDAPDWLDTIVDDLKLLHFQDGQFCRHCGAEWPCPTLRAIPAHLS